MQPDTTLALSPASGGDPFIFSSLEIPSEIKFGGSQQLAVHKLIGGARVIDAVGRDDRPLEWSGFFMGDYISDPITRALYLDGLRVSGAPQILSWSAFLYQVIVKEFEANYQRRYQIPYRITCEVIADLSNPVTTTGIPPIDQALNDDMTLVAGLGLLIADPTLTGLLNTLSLAVGSVPTFAHAPQSTITSVSQPLTAVRARTQSLMTLNGSAVGSTTHFGGVVAGTPSPQLATSLNGQLSSNNSMTNLINLRNATGRMQGNLGSINASANQTPVVGGNLFQIAQKQYGDATAWTGIAKANGLTDPMIAGVKTLTIPPQPDVSGGVLAG